MMGRKGSVGKLFYQFSLEERVPQEHLLRRVLTAVDFSFVRRTTARFSSHTGQPSIDPVVIFKMALIGYLYGITSERRLVQEIGLNLAYLWFIGDDLDESVPDHSALSKARARFGPPVDLGFFQEIVRPCEQAGLVRGDKVYLDSTLVEANASIDSVGPRALISQLPDASEHVRKLWEDNSDQAPGPDTPTSTPRAPVPLPAVSPVAPVAQEPTASDGNPELARAAESVSAPPSAAPTPDRGGEPTPATSLHLAGPADPPNKVVGAFHERLVSRVDPGAEVVSRARVVPDLSDKVHAGVEAGRARIVTAVEVTGGGVTDEPLLQRWVREHAGNVGRHRNEVGADTKDGTVDNYRWREGRGTRASIPMVDTSASKAVLPTEAFEYDPKSDSFRCPNGQKLARQGVLTTSAGLSMTLYQAQPKPCAGCPRKEGCCGKSQARSIPVADDGGVRERARVYLATFPARPSIRRRKAWIETIFGDGKERRGLRRARCRGGDGMRVQAGMTAIAPNVRQLALRKGTRPEIGAGALEKPSPVPFFLSLPRLQPAHITPNHNLTLSLSLN